MKGYRLFIWNSREEMLNGMTEDIMPVTADFKNYYDAENTLKNLICAGVPVALDYGQEISDEEEEK